MRFRLDIDGERHEIEVASSGRGTTIRVDGALYRTAVLRRGAFSEVRIGKARHRIEFRGREILVDGEPHAVSVEALEPSEGNAAPGGPSRERRPHDVRPPMPGRIVRVMVSPGGSVRKGQAIAVLEAMKMQNEIPSPVDGVVREVHVREGESIGADRVIARLESV